MNINTYKQTRGHNQNYTDTYNNTAPIYKNKPTTHQHMKNIQTHQTITLKQHTQHTQTTINTIYTKKTHNNKQNTQT